MQIIDSHAHFWQPDHLRYAWLDDLPSLNRPFLSADYRAASAGYDVAGIVFVQADCAPEQGIAEAEWVASLAGEIPIKGIVAFAPLEQGDRARELLERLAAMPLVKGVRRLIQSEGAGFALQADFVAGVRSLADYGLSFDLCVRHHQLGDVIALVDACPNVAFVLDHIGKPDIAAGKIDDWRRDISALAARENVCCKLSGMVTEANVESWTRDDLAPYADHVLEAFGVGRVMFGSDYPVVTLAASYGQWVETAQELVAELSEDEQRQVFYENAKRFYRI